MTWDASKDDDLIRRGDLKKKYLEYSFFPALISDALQKAPAIDAVSREVFEQVQWERDIAITQLAEYGVGFGEKKKDLVEVKHGHWIIPTKIGNRSFNIPHCSVCEGVPCGVDEHTKYCPNCGADMRERKADETD